MQTFRYLLQIFRIYFLNSDIFSLGHRRQRPGISGSAGLARCGRRDLTTMQGSFQSVTHPAPIFIILALFQVDGDKYNFTMDLTKLHSEKDWSPNCDNSTNTNLFNFTIRAIVEVDGNNITGPWSEPITVPAYCNGKGHPLY